MIEKQKSKKVRVSKNRKKSWRKHCDISDVEKHLDTERKNEIIGDEYENVDDSELFFVSKKPNQEAPIRKKTVRSLNDLKCFSQLKSTSAVKDPLKKRNRVRSPSEKTSEWVKRIKREAEITKPSRIQAAKYRKAADAAYKKRKKENKRAAEGKFKVFDLWDEPKVAKEETVIGKDLMNFYLEETRQKPATRAPHTKLKTSKVAAVEVPHPGASYNPTYSDHQELLGLANDIELDKVKKENAIYKNTTAMFPTKDEAPTQETWLKEMSGCLFDESGDESDGSCDDDKTTTHNATVTDDTRKTRQKRRREKKAKVKAIKTARLKDMYQRESQVYRVKTLYKEIQDEDTKKEDSRKAKRAVKQQKLDFEPRKLSRLNFAPQDLEVNLSSEVTGNLRLVKTEGDLLEDRYKSLLKRNIIEPRVKHNLKSKYKRKKFRRANDLTEADTKGVTVRTKLGELTVKLQK